MARVDYDEINRLAPLAKQGDSDATERLLTAVYPFVGWIIKEKGLFLPSGADRQDLEQEGVIAVFEALEDWDPEKQPEFKWFAKLCVERKVISAVRMATREKRRAQNEATSLDAPAVHDRHGQEGDPDRLSRWDLPDASGLGMDPADLTAGSEASDLAEAFFVGMTVLEREVLTKVLLGGSSYKDLSAELKVSDKSIDNAMQRVRRKVLQRAQEMVQDYRFTDGTRALLQRTADLAVAPRYMATDEELRATLPVEILRPSGLVRYSRGHNQWTVPADRLLQEYPNIRDFATDGAKQAVLEAYLTDRPWEAVAAEVNMTVGAAKHHLRRTCQKAALAQGSVKLLEYSTTPLYQRVEQLWCKGISIAEIHTALSHVARPEQIQTTINRLYNRKARERLREVPDQVETRRIPLVRLSAIPGLLRKAKELVIPAYRETLKLYMQGYSGVEISRRRGVADSCVGKNDLPLIRRALKGVAGFEWLYDKCIRERQLRLLSLDALGVTEAEALARIPPHHVATFKLYLAGYAHREIDRKLGHKAGSAEKNLHYCRDCIRRRDNRRTRARRSETTDRNAARRIHSNPDLYRLYQAYGIHLDPSKRRLLEMHFHGDSVTTIAESFGLVPSPKSRQSLWGRVKRTGELLRKVEQEAAPGRQVAHDTLLA